MDFSTTWIDHKDVQGVHTLKNQVVECLQNDVENRYYPIPFGNQTSTYQQNFY